MERPISYCTTTERLIFYANVGLPWMREDGDALDIVALSRMK